MEPKSDHSPKKRTNISISEQTYGLLKKQAKRQNTTMSQLITDWIWYEESVSGPVLVNREWVKELDTETLERLLQFSYENHTTPAQAVRDWIWSKKVKNEVIPLMQDYTHMKFDQQYINNPNV